MLEVRAELGRSDYAVRLLKRAARAYLRELGLGGAELSVLVVSDPRIRALNRKWRRKDRPTDVLSFPAAEAARGPRPLGDVVISLDTARRRAREDGRALRAELERYLAHGLLHLLGHDHHRPGDARKMKRTEEALLRSVEPRGVETLTALH